jgi:hypothetical protein
VLHTLSGRVDGMFVQVAQVASWPAPAVDVRGQGSSKERRRLRIIIMALHSIELPLGPWCSVAARGHLRAWRLASDKSRPLAQRPALAVGRAKSP